MAILGKTCVIVSWPSYSLKASLLCSEALGRRPWFQLMNFYTALPLSLQLLKDASKTFLLLQWHSFLCQVVLLSSDGSYWPPPVPQAFALKGSGCMWLRLRKYKCLTKAQWEAVGTHSAGYVAVISHKLLAGGRMRPSAEMSSADITKSGFAQTKFTRKTPTWKLCKDVIIEKHPLPNKNTGRLTRLMVVWEQEGRFVVRTIMYGEIFFS